MISENAYHHAAIKLGTIFSWFGLFWMWFSLQLAHHIYGFYLFQTAKVKLIKTQEIGLESFFEFTI
jgi:hypothetical protein